MKENLCEAHHILLSLEPLISFWSNGFLYLIPTVTCYVC